MFIQIVQPVWNSHLSILHCQNYCHPRLIRLDYRTEEMFCTPCFRILKLEFQWTQKSQPLMLQLGPCWIHLLIFRRLIIRFTNIASVNVIFLFRFLLSVVPMKYVALRFAQNRFLIAFRFLPFQLAKRNICLTPNLTMNGFTNSLAAPAVLWSF